MQRALRGYAEARGYPIGVDSLIRRSGTFILCVLIDAKRAMRGQAFGASGPSCWTDVRCLRAITSTTIRPVPLPCGADSTFTPCRADVDVVWACARDLMRMTNGTPGPPHSTPGPPHSAPGPPHITRRPALLAQACCLASTSAAGASTARMRAARTGAQRTRRSAAFAAASSAVGAASAATAAVPAACCPSAPSPCLCCCCCCHFGHSQRTYTSCARLAVRCALLRRPLGRPGRWHRCPRARVLLPSHAAPLARVVEHHVVVQLDRAHAGSACGAEDDVELDVGAAHRLVGPAPCHAAAHRASREGQRHRQRAPCFW